jgi:chromate transporter
MRNDLTWALVAIFVPFSLTSIGGGPSVFAGIQHQAVDVHHWVSAREFVDLFAISRAARHLGSSGTVNLVRLQRTLWVWRPCGIR